MAAFNRKMGSCDGWSLQANTRSMPSGAAKISYLNSFDSEFNA